MIIKFLGVLKQIVVEYMNSSWQPSNHFLIRAPFFGLVTLLYGHLEPTSRKRVTPGYQVM